MRFSLTASTVLCSQEASPRLHHGNVPRLLGHGFWCCLSSFHREDEKYLAWRQPRRKTMINTSIYHPITSSYNLDIWSTKGIVHQRPFPGPVFVVFVYFYFTKFDFVLDTENQLWHNQSFNFPLSHEVETNSRKLQPQPQVRHKIAQKKPLICWCV